MLESFVSRFSVSPSGRVTALARIVTSLHRIRVLYYHISTGKSHIINRIYPHLLCKSTNIQSLCLCLITFLNTTFFFQVDPSWAHLQKCVKTFSPSPPFKMLDFIHWKKHKRHTRVCHSSHNAFELATVTVSYFCGEPLFRVSDDSHQNCC